MTASRVHAVIAAGLENPALLSLWQREPERLRDCGVDPDKLDLNALWKIAGLTAKVRHNGLRADLPLTFRLLNVAGLEIEVFASYASFQASNSRRYADTADARAQDLLCFLQGWLDFDRREHVLLWDLIRHELALKQLSRLGEGASAVPAKTPAQHFVRRTTAVPRVCGDVVLHEMRSDSQLVGRILERKSPRLNDIPLGMFYVCYWRNSRTAEICILQLDELGFYLLSLADGMRSISDLSCLMGGPRRPARGFLTALDILEVVGILTFDTERKKRR
jgi:hypothetical protein